MPVEFLCSNPNCKKKLSVSDDKEGKKVRCPSCKTVCSAPAAETESLDVLSPRRLLIEESIALMKEFEKTCEVQWTQ
jgi:hypothetical protein